MGKSGKPWGPWEGARHPGLEPRLPGSCPQSALGELLPMEEAHREGAGRFRLRSFPSNPGSL